ncbi:hypothetical protein AJ79_02546 [Helicocarpus griseus UAMH5409]|uniref:Uncharacterized protein n=1 Tax=Helicocarpus griseus UAMH5409 TaxID=1447875 RepID=A0A2B7Y2A6_9EURO|nr:hypothetical protein AJ79_02546 [Helicocarpus griseus UAMH5409]
MSTSSILLHTLAETVLEHLQQGQWGIPPAPATESPNQELTDTLGQLGDPCTNLEPQEDSPEEVVAVEYGPSETELGAGETQTEHAISLLQLVSDVKDDGSPQASTEMRSQWEHYGQQQRQLELQQQQQRQEQLQHQELQHRELRHQQLQQQGLQQPQHSRKRMRSGKLRAQQHRQDVIPTVILSAPPVNTESPIPAQILVIQRKESFLAAIAARESEIQACLKGLEQNTQGTRTFGFVAKSIQHILSHSVALLYI